MWDRWPALVEQFKHLHDWTPYRASGQWPDADLLPLGLIAFGRQTRFTRDEQTLLMTLWSIARSPLMHGGDMTKTDDFTLSLLTNGEVLAVNQRSTNNRQLFRTGDGLVAWIADVPGSAAKYLAVFNLRNPHGSGPADSKATVLVKWSDLGLVGKVQVRDLWRHADLDQISGEFRPQVQPHGARLFLLSPNQ